LKPYLNENFEHIFKLLGFDKLVLAT
jgi:hypothetical protein